MSDFTFKLCLDSRGMTVTQGSFGTNAFAFSNSSSAKVNFSEKDLTFTLYGLNFHRKLYEPGHIEAEVLIHTQLEDGVTIDLKYLETMLLRRPASLIVGDDKVIAENYYIHAFTPIFEIKQSTTPPEEAQEEDPRGESKSESESESEDQSQSESTVYYDYDIYTKLDIYSMDKLLTLDKFSRAYLGKKLMNNIIADGVDEFKLGFKYLDQGNPITVDNLVKINACLRLENLSNSNVELIHPYLVQYNESFYDFICRVANRCGEPLYFEGGQLRMGLPWNEDNKNHMAANTCATPTRLFCNSISGGAVTVNGYHRDSAKTGDGTPKKFNDEETDKGSEGYPTDAFADYAHPYNSELAAEDHYILLYKDKFARRSAEVFTSTKSHLFFDPDPAVAGVSVIPEILNSTSLMELLVDFSFQLVINGIKYAAAVKKAQTEGEKVITPYLLNSSNTYATLFAKVDSNSNNWLTMSYYEGVRKGQEEQNRKRICVDMGEVFEDRKLGEVVKVPGAENKQYVIVQIDMTSGIAWQRSYDVNVPAKKEQDWVNGNSSLQFQAIPIADDGKFYPPALPGNPFRRANGPQPAFVTDADDPKRQGRVRIRFAWQTELSSIESAPDLTAKKTQAEAEAKTAQTKLEQYATGVSYSRSTDGLITVVCTKKSGADDAAYKAALADYKSRCEALETIVNYQRDAVSKYGDDSSPWIRMVTPMATDTGGGMYFRPEVGDEVMVDFENGNIDHPFVTGALFSKTSTAPDVGKRAIVSRNGHTIRFVDPDDASLFVAGTYPGLKLLKSYSVPFTFDVKNARSALGGIEMTDRCGLYRIMMSSHDRKIAISSPFGDVDIDAFTGITLSAPNGNIKIVGQNVEITANNNLTLTSGQNIKNGAFYKFDGAEALKILGKKIASTTYGPFFDFTLLRTILEVVIRPVDGTLKIKSNRFLLLEAGDGEASIAADQYERESVFKSFKQKGLSQIPTTAAVREEIREVTTYLFTTLPDRIDSYLSEFITTFNKILDDLNQLRNEGVSYFQDEREEDSYFYLKGFDNPTDMVVYLFSALELDPLLSDQEIKANTFADLQHFQYRDNCPPNDAQHPRVTFIRATVDCCNQIISLKRIVKRYEEFIVADDDPDYGGVRERFNTILKNPFPAMPVPTDGSQNKNPFVFYTWIKTVQDLSDNHGDGAILTHSHLDPHSFDPWKKAIVRRMAKVVIEYVTSHDSEDKDYRFAMKEFNQIPIPDSVGQFMDPKPDNEDEPFSDQDWARYIHAIDIQDKPVAESVQSLGGAFVDGLTDSFKKKILSWGEWKVWSDVAKGQIVFSNEEGFSYRFNQNGLPEKYVTPYGDRLSDVTQDLISKLANL